MVNTIFLNQGLIHYGRQLLCRVPKHMAKPYMHTAKTIRHSDVGKGVVCRVPKLTHGKKKQKT